MSDVPSLNAQAPAERESFLLKLARQPDKRLDRWLAPIIAFLTVLVYFQAVDGSWVWDDHVQIVNNQQIKDPALVVRALTTDVWSFRSTQGGNESRYWRPSFVAWMIAMERISGTASATLWHVSLVILHAIASVLAYFVARRVGFSPLWAAPIALIFAMHPTRPESVVWISGATDPILAVFMFGSLLCVLGAVNSAPMPRGATERVGSTHFLRRRPLLWLGGLLLFAGALGAKEVAILFPGLVFACAVAYRSGTSRGSADGASSGQTLDRRSLLPAAVATAPFVALTVAYLGVRYALLGPDTRSADMFLPFEVNIYTLPRVGLFYVRQCLAPYEVSPFYVLSHQVKPDFEGFFLPGLGLLAVGSVMLWIVLGPARSRASALGLAIFALILAPAAYVTNFPPPDQLVHDRYLYIPLLGMLLMVAGLAAWMCRRVDRARAAVAVLCVGVLLCGVMARYTMRYAEAWKNGMGMWGWATVVSPGSPMAWQHYGLELAQKERHDEAQLAYARAMEIQPTPHGFLVSAESLMAQGKLDQAESLFMFIVDRVEQTGTFRAEYFYALDFVARIRVMRDEDVDGAVAMYERGIRQLPAYRATLYDRIGLVLIAARRWDEAEAALKEGLPLIQADAMSQARMIHYRLGQVYMRSERFEEAEREFLTYLNAIDGFDDPQLVEGGLLARMALLQMGQLNMQAEKLDEAQRLFELFAEQAQGVNVPEIAEGVRKARMAIDGIEQIRRQPAGLPTGAPAAPENGTP